MRTTLTLESDVAQRLRQEIASKRLSLKEVINTVLRRGFSMEKSPKQSRYRVPVISSAFHAGVDPGKLNQLLDELDAENFPKTGSPLR